MRTDLELIRQPPGSNLCGQCCVAMVAGLTLDESIAIFGRRGKTSWRQVGTVLDVAGVRRDAMAVGTPGLYRRLIARLRVPGSDSSHYAVWSFGCWWDPEFGVSAEKHHPRWHPAVHVSSFMRIH